MHASMFGVTCCNKIELSIALASEPHANISVYQHKIGWLLVAGKWQGQRAKAVEKALLGSALDVDTLIQALQALPNDLHPTSTPGEPLNPMLSKRTAPSAMQVTSNFAARSHWHFVVSMACHGALTSQACGISFIPALLQVSLQTLCQVQQKGCC